MAFDLEEYIDLDLLDRDPQDVFDNAVLNLTSYYPELQMREGMIETVLLETMSLQVAEAIFAINRLPPAITEVLLSMLDIDRDPGAPPTVDVRFEMGITTGTTIPAGVTMVLNLDGGLEPIVFTTDSELVIPSGADFGVVSATGDRYTADANNVQAETSVEIQDSLTYVDYARLNTIVTGGRDPEDDVAFLNRGIQRLSRLTSTLLLPRHFESAAIEYPFVKKVKALDNYDSVADVGVDGPVGVDLGYIAVAVYGDNENVSVDDKAILQEYFDANSMSALTVTIINPTVTAINVTAEIHIDADALAADVIDAVEEELKEFLSPLNWDWADTVRYNELISIITNVPGVDWVEDITIPVADVTLPGVAHLTTFGVLDISVAP